MKNFTVQYKFNNDLGAIRNMNVSAENEYRAENKARKEKNNAILIVRCFECKDRDDSINHTTVSFRKVSTPPKEFKVSYPPALPGAYKFIP
jgi:hypothetical protein